MNAGSTDKSTAPEGLVSLISDYTSMKIDRRQFLTTAGRLGLSVSAAGALLAACGSPSAGPSSSASSAAPTKTLTYRPGVDIANLDPATWVSQDDEIIADCIFEGLVSYRPGTFDVVNTLAESFEPSSDKLSFHFTLKPGIEWQKGYGEVRASDVKFSYERIAGLTKPKVNSPYAGDWQALDTVRVEGPYEGTIVLKHAFAPIMASTLPVMSGKVLPEKAVTTLGKKFATNPVGSGPYEFGSWVPGQHVVLNRFARYSGANRAYAAKTPWSTIETQVVSSDATALEALATGSVDYGYLGISTVAKAKATSSVKVVTKPGQSFNFLALNVTDPVLRNKNLRYAIRSAIDVPGILKAAYYDLYPRAYAIIPPSMKVGYWAGAPHYNQDIPLAKKYLAASGLSKVSLRLNLLNDQTDENACQIIAANLAQIGINVTLDPQDSATYYAIPGNGGGGTHRQLNYVGYTTEPDPYWSYIWFTCAQMGLWNWSDWCNHTFTSLLNEAVLTYDNTKREQLYVQADKLWDAEAAMVWICYNGGSYAYLPAIKPCIRPDSIPVLWNTAAS